MVVNVLIHFRDYEITTFKLLATFKTPTCLFFVCIIAVVMLGLLICGS